jgi:hypothetical protein
MSLGHVALSLFKRKIVFSGTFLPCQHHQPSSPNLSTRRVNVPGYNCRQGCVNVPGILINMIPNPVVLDIYSVSSLFA